MSNRNQIAGIALIVVGALFLFGRGFSGIDFGHFLWPFFVLVPGLVLLGSAFLGNRGTAHLAMPGAIVSTIGIILLVLNVTGYWQAWAYCWAVIIVGVGIGNLLYGSLSNDSVREQDGMRTIYVGLALFAAFGAFFEFLIWGGLGGTLRWVLPLLLIGGGVYLLMRDGKDKKPFTVQTPAPQAPAAPVTPTTQAPSAPVQTAPAETTPPSTAPSETTQTDPDTTN